MADISILARLVNGATRNVDLTTNTPVVLSIKIGGVTNTELTKTILDNLVNLQNGSDFSSGTNAHTHDGRYFTESELGSSTSSSGSDLIGDDNTYSNFTPTAATVKGALAGIDTALASAGNVKVDNVFRIADDGDNSKRIAFEASGISASTTRTITMPDANVNLADVNNAILKDGSRTFTANQPMGGFKLTGLAAGTGAGDSVRYEQAILTSGVNAFAANQSFGSFKATNLADPTAAQDAATKAYVDSLLDGRSWKQSVKAASTANINLASNSDPNPIDGVTLSNNNRVLLKDQTAPEENGIYIAVDATDPTTWIRSSDANTALELTGAAVFVEQGTANGDKQFAQTADNITLGTTAITWVVTSANSFSGHDMISLSGGQISIDLATTSGLESTNPGNAAGQLRIKLEASNPSLRITGSNELAAKLDPAGAIASGASGLATQVDGSTIEISSNALRVKDAGITLAKLASDSVDENKIVSTAISATGALDGGSGTKLSVRVDNTSIEKSSNNLRIKSTAYDQSTITGGSGSAAAVAFAPAVKAASEVAGEAFSASTLYAVRYGQNAETAGRIYKADKDASSTDNFYVIGLVKTSGALSAADPMPAITKSGLLTATSHGFTVGKPVYLDASGALTSTAPSAANQAIVRVGMVKDANTIDVQISVVGVA